MSEKRLRNTDTILVFPLIDYSTGEYYAGTWAGLTNATIEAYHWSDGVAPQALSIAGTPTQIGSTGLWQLSLSASELNISSQYVIIKFDADELAAQGVTIDLVDSLIETVAGQIKAKTDLIPANPATSTEVAACLQASGYIEPDNAGIAAIKTKTDNLPSDPASNTQVNTRLASADYTAPSNTEVLAAIALCLQAADYVAPDNSDVLAAIGDLQNISVADILANQSIKDALTVIVGNHAISGSTLTHTRTGADNVAFTITETSKTRA